MKKQKSTHNSTLINIISGLFFFGVMITVLVGITGMIVNGIQELATTGVLNKELSDLSVLTTTVWGLWAMFQIQNGIDNCHNSEKKHVGKIKLRHAIFSICLVVVGFAMGLLLVKVSAVAAAVAFAIAFCAQGFNYVRGVYILMAN